MRSAKQWVFVAVGMLSLGLAPRFAAAQNEAFAPPKAGKEHKIFESELGTWDATIKSWETPKGEPMESKGVEKNTMMPGGLWLLSEFTGDFGGMEFHGRGQYGFDTHKKKYVGTWIDSMGTSPMVMEGTYDEKTHTMTLEGESFDPAQNKMIKMRTVGTTKPDGSRVMAMYIIPGPDGKDAFKMMEITYSKRK